MKKNGLIWLYWTNDNKEYCIKIHKKITIDTYIEYRELFGCNDKNDLFNFIDFVWNYLIFIHNAKFDINFLQKEFDFLWLKALKKTNIDEVWVYIEK